MLTGAGYKETPLTPAPTPVAGQQPVEDMLPGNEQIDNPLYEDQGVQVDDTQVDDSGYEQGTTFHSSPVFEHDSPAQGAYSPYIHSPELVERVHSDSSLSFTAPDADHHESIYATPSFEESGETQHQAFRNNPAFLDEPKSVSVPTDTGGDRYPMVRYNLPMPSQITTAVVTEQDVEPEHPVEVESHPMFSSTSAFATSSHEPAVLPVLETAQPELTPEPILSSTSTFTAPAEEQHTFEVLETAQQGSGVMSAEPSFTRDIVDAAPAGVADEPQVNSFSSQPIFGSEPQQAVVQYLPDIQREPSFALAPSADSFEPPAFTSHPVFDAEPQSGVSASNRLSFDGLLQQDYPTALHTVATAPSIDEQGPAFHSTPLLPHSEPQFGLAEANVALPSSPAFSDRPLLNAQQPLQMPTDIIEPFSPATSVHSAVFSDRPLLGTQQHQQVITDTLVSPAASAQSVFSNRPLLGGSQHAPVHAPEPAPSAAPFASSFSDRPLLSEAQTEQVLFYAPEPTPSEAVPSSLSSRPLLTQAQPEQVLPHTPEPFSPAASLQSVFSDRPILGGVQSQQVTTYANQAYDWSAQPASPAASLQSTGFSNRPLLAGTQQQVPYTTPAAPTIPAISSQSTAFSDRPVLGEAQPSFATAAVQHDSFPEHDVTFHTQPLLDKAQLQPASALASPSPVPTTAYTASLDTAQQTQPAIFSATPLLSATPPLSGTPPFSATPLLGSPAQPAFTSPMLTDDPTLGDEFGSYNFGFHPVAPKTTTNIMLEEPSILSQPFAPTQNAVIASSDNPFAERVPLPQQPMDDPLYDPTSRTHTPPVISPHHQKQLHKTAAPLKPLDDPLYDPAAGTRPVPLPDVAAKPALVHEPEPRPAYVPRPMLAPEPVSYGHINIAHWPVPLLHLINDPVYGPAVEAAILEAGRTNVAVQVGTPRVSAQSSAAAAQPQHVTAGRFSEAAYSANRRAPGTVNLQNIGRPAQPLAPQVEEVSYQPKPEYEMGGADVLPQDPHYVKPTGYSELGAAARSALSGAGWKPDWAFEVELAKREAAGTVA